MSAWGFWKSTGSCSTTLGSGLVYETMKRTHRRSKKRVQYKSVPVVMPDFSAEEFEYGWITTEK
jgi:hypothetical protein